jgi:hypothetical protein
VVNDFLKVDDFVALEQEMLAEFMEQVKPYMPEGMVILKKGWEDLFLFHKAALAGNMPEQAYHRQMQKLIGGWYSQGAVK